MRVGILKNIEGITIHPPTQNDYRIAMPDEAEPRGHHHILIGCRIDIHDVVEFELRKAARNDEKLSSWKEVTRRF